MAHTNVHFQKSQLPPPRSFYERELGRLSRPDRKGWARANCPFHASKSKTSFQVNLSSGAFCCFGCDARGGDVLSFVRLRDGVSFKEAAIRLGCWDEAPSAETRLRLTAQAVERNRQRQIEEGRKAEQHRRLIAIRDQVHAALRIRREAEERLDELHAGATPATDDEAETCWALAALAFDYQRDQESEYMEAAGLEYFG